MTRSKSFTPEELTELAGALRAVWHALVSGMHSSGALEGLQRQQFWVLGALARGPLRMSDLASCTQTSQASLTGIVDRLVERGLVVRERAGADRRVVEVALTPEGQAEMRRAHAGMLDRLEELLSPLGTEERLEFARLVSAITVGSLAEQDPHRPC